MPKSSGGKKTPAGLTPAQEAFCLAVVETNNQAEAYRRAYPKSLKWKPESVFSHSSRLMSNRKVSARVEELRAQVAKNALYTPERIIRELGETREMAIRDGEYTAAVAASMGQAKILGYGNDKLQLVSNVSNVLVIHTTEKDAENG
jgi:hypothetical protein